ncbi:hypothetical protein GCM10027568_24710 [Humibacter soli]
MLPRIVNPGLRARSTRQRMPHSAFTQAHPGGLDTPHRYAGGSAAGIDGTQRRAGRKPR